MKSRSLRNEIVLTGGNYWNGGQGQIIISPTEEKGVYINGILVNPQTLQAQSLLGARFLVTDNGSGHHPTKVVEHLLSGVFGAGIRSARILTPETVPVIGPGIAGIYDSLICNSDTLSCQCGPQRIIKNVKFVSSDGTCTMEIKATQTFSLGLEIERNSDPEVGADSSLCIDDIYVTMESSKFARNARPIARLKSPISNVLQRVLNLIGAKGITSENYILNRSNTTQQELVQQMYKEFQAQNNEHLMHTAIADFFGELHTFFPQGLYGKIVFKGKNNHFTRMELLQKMSEENIF